jgi:hypothetical protein
MQRAWQQVVQQVRAEADPLPQQRVAPLHVDNTTRWRHCVQRTPRNDRWRCALDASGRARGRVLAEGLPPVFGLHDTATADDTADSWIVVMDNERISPQDIVELCDPAVSGASCLWLGAAAQYRATRHTRREHLKRTLLRLACTPSGFCEGCNQRRGREISGFLVKSIAAVLCSRVQDISYNQRCVSTAPDAEVRGGGGGDGVQGSRTMERGASSGTLASCVGWR